MPATPAGCGDSFLQGLYNDLYALDDPTLRGTKQYYFTTTDLSAAGLRDLLWWEEELCTGLKRQMQCGVTTLAMVVATLLTSLIVVLYLNITR